MKKFLIAAVAVSTLAITTPVLTGTTMAGETPSAPGAKVYFVNLKDGMTVKSPIKIVFGLSGMGVAPAGTEKAKTGHHHLFINRAPFGKGEAGAAEADANVPSDGNHKHFGGGQTELMLELAPGKHTLQMVLADKDHIPHNPPVVSPVISITVE